MPGPADAPRPIGRGASRWLPEGPRQITVAVWSRVVGVAAVVIDPMDDRTSTVTVNLDHGLNVWPDRDRGRATAPLECDRTVGERRPFGDDADTAHAGRVRVPHQDESPRHLAVSGPRAPPGSAPKPIRSCPFSAGIPVYPLSNVLHHTSWWVIFKHEPGWRHCPYRRCMASMHAVHDRQADLAAML